MLSLSILYFKYLFKPPRLQSRQNCLYFLIMLIIKYKLLLMRQGLLSQLILLFLYFVLTVLIIQLLLISFLKLHSKFPIFFNLMLNIFLIIMRPNLLMHLIPLSCYYMFLTYLKLFAFLLLIIIKLLRFIIRLGHQGQAINY